MTATSGASVCAYDVSAPSSTLREAIPTRNFSEFQKRPRSTAAAAQQQQQRCTTREPRNAHIHENACVLFQLATPPGIQANYIPKRNLNHTYRM